MPGSIAAALAACLDGAAILRVHDVAETVQAVRRLAGILRVSVKRMVSWRVRDSLSGAPFRDLSSMTSTRRLFGTDGIRGTANTDPMTAETALRLGQAAGLLFTRGAHRHRVVIGKDTRLSGYMIEPALTAGFIGAGMDVVLVGPLPTPAIAMLTRSLRADLGVMISASHNPFEDNGIKLFGPDGYKLSDETEAEIEALMDGDLSPQLAAPAQLGRALAAGGCGRPLYRVGQGQLPARRCAGRAEDRGRLRQRRRLPRGAHGAVGTGRRGDRRSASRRTGSTSTAAAAHHAGIHVRRGAAPRRRISASRSTATPTG